MSIQEIRKYHIFNDSQFFVFFIFIKFLFCHNPWTRSASTLVHGSKQYFVIRGRKSDYSTKVAKLAARAGSEYPSDTSRRRVLSVVRAKGECAYFTISIKCPFFRTCITLLLSNKCIKNPFLHTCMQTPRLHTIYRQQKWPPLAPVRKIMNLGRKIMALGCKIIAVGWNVFY